MKKVFYSGNTTGGFVVAPEFSLFLSEAESLSALTAEAFMFADDKGKKRLFKMRSFLNEIFPAGIKSPDTPAEQIATLNRMKDYLSKADHKDCTVSDFGNISLLDDSDEYFSSLLDCTDHITVDSVNIDTDSRVRHFVKYVSSAKFKLYLLMDRYIPDSTASIIGELWKYGADITLCGKDSIASSFAYSGFTPHGNVDFYNGIPLIRGQSLIKTATIDTDSISDSETVYNIYGKIKCAVAELADKEVASRFTRANKGGLRYRPENEHLELAHLDLLYKNCISVKDRKIKGIFSGGAEYDCLYITIDEANANSISALAAACKAYDGLYPLKLIPFCRIKRTADNCSDLRDILSDHLSSTKTVYGASILELTVCDNCLIDSIKDISSFFRMGGMILNLKHKEL